MKKQGLPSPDILRKLLRYEPDTGRLFWRDRTPDMFQDKGRSATHSCSIWNSIYAGKEAFTEIVDEGYRRGRIFGCKYRAHRVIWAIAYGEWPAGQIDHINGLRGDNRINNLRIVTHRENGLNQKLNRENTSGISGVHWHKRAKRWHVRISDDNGRRHLGSFADKADAIAARKSAEIALGYHENHGKERSAT